MTYTVTEAKNNLPELIRQAEEGATITITKRGVPVVEIVKRSDNKRKRSFSGIKSNVVLDPDWARPQEDFDAWLSGDV